MSDLVFYRYCMNSMKIDDVIYWMAWVGLSEPDRQSSANHNSAQTTHVKPYPIKNMPLQSVTLTLTNREKTGDWLYVELEFPLAVVGGLMGFCRIMRTSQVDAAVLDPGKSSGQGPIQ